MGTGGERIWDGRGGALDDARMTVAHGRLADDLRLGVTHFRVMAHVGRQNSQRGWLRVSQSELATRWDCHRNSVNRAFGDLVRWGYLTQRTQKEAGESFCLYKVALDGEGDACQETKPAAHAESGECTRKGAPRGECTPKGAPRGECTPKCARGSALNKVHVCTSGKGTGAQRDCAPHYTTDKPTDAAASPTPRGGRRRGRGGEGRDWLSSIETPGRRDAIEDFLRPLLADVQLISGDPLLCLAELSDELAKAPAAVRADALRSLRAGRGAKVKAFDIRCAIEAASRAARAVAGGNKTAMPKAPRGGLAVMRITSRDPSFSRWVDAAPTTARGAIEAAGEVSASCIWPQEGARMYAPVDMTVGAA